MAISPPSLSYSASPHATPLQLPQSPQDQLPADLSLDTPQSAPSKLSSSSISIQPTSPDRKSNSSEPSSLHVRVSYPPTPSTSSPRISPPINHPNPLPASLPSSSCCKYCCSNANNHNYSSKDNKTNHLYDPLAHYNVTPPLSISEAILRLFLR